jgi:hypothetical protein
MTGDSGWWLGWDVHYQSNYTASNGMAGHGWGMLYHPESATGIRRDSCGIDWPDTAPILSEKDQEMTPLDEFDSPFSQAVP